MKKRIWILLRGLAREQGHWGDFPQKLESKDGAQVIVLDWPGLGANCEQNMPLSPERVVAHLEGQLWQMVPNKSAPLGIIGLSLGGALGLYWCNLKPGVFDRVVAINASLANLSAPWVRLRLFAFAKLMALLGEPSIETREQEILRLTSHCQTKKSKELIEAWVLLAKAHPVRLQTFWRQALLAAQIRVRKPLFAKPLILASKKDALVDFRASEAISHYFHAPLFIHEEAGHDLPLDDPDWCIEKIVGF